MNIKKGSEIRLMTTERILNLPHRKLSDVKDFYNSRMINNPPKGIIKIISEIYSYSFVWSFDVEGSEWTWLDITIEEVIKE